MNAMSETKHPSHQSHQDWFMMTGDLIINLTATKSQDMSNQKKNLRQKSTPNLLNKTFNQKQFNSEPNSPSNTCLNSNGLNIDPKSDENGFNDKNNGFEHKETQTNNNLNQNNINHKNDYNYNKSDKNNDIINDFVPKRQMSLPLVRFHKSDDQLLTTNNITVVDINCSEETSNSLNTLLSSRHSDQLSNRDIKSTDSVDSSPGNDHRFNDDEEQLLSNSTSTPNSSPNGSDSHSLTISSANVSPTKTLTTQQTESSMSENYSLISSISCQTIDQNRNKSSLKRHNDNQTLSLSSSMSDDSTTPSSSPEESLIRNDFENLNNVSYNEQNRVKCQQNGCVDQKEDNNKSDVINTKFCRTSVSTVQKSTKVDNSSNTAPQQTVIGGSDEDSSDTESHYSPPKGVDTPGALRLAKRLYDLNGFKKTDVSRHLSKNNEFSRVVAEEYLKYFDFKGDSLDSALRKFLTRFCLIGETQERERVLVHFSKRFLDCNPKSPFKSNDAVHTLTCAIMLLNTDLHGENVGQRMTCSEFIQNLSEMNDGYDFPPNVLRPLYQAIKESPLQWNADENNESQTSERNGTDLMAKNLSQQISIIGHNPFLEVPNPNCATEYKKGYVMRKSCYESNGKKTPMGRRGWKMFYATLRDLILYLHKDEQGFRKNPLYESLSNSIRVHHSLASNASDYTKKQFVFRLITADHAEYLFQTSDSRELQSWIDTINTVAASLSSPPLPEAVGSDIKKFQRPLMPVSHTKLNLREQLADHERRTERLSAQLDEHLSKGPQKKYSKRQMTEFSEKESFLQHELKRYQTYVSALKWKLSQINLINNLNATQMLSTSSALPLQSVAIGEETGDEANDTPVIIPVKKICSTDSIQSGGYHQNTLHTHRSLIKRDPKTVETGFPRIFKKF